MNINYFTFHYEGKDWRMRTIIYANEYLFLYELEPEDRILYARFGVKFVTQPKNGFLDIRCSNAVNDHLQYEAAIMNGLKQYLVSGRLLS
ncbi:MAG TPA: hypothetical protein VG605_00580 [Puia sp.]|jgi:hypothetical protein|nr:hypothetical protein [Puia sp.]